MYVYRVILWVERYLVGLTLLVGTAIVVCVVATTVVLDCTIQLVGTAIVVCVVATTVVYNRRSTRLKV